MANVLGSHAERAHRRAARRCSRAFPEARVHLYGKGIRPGRKLGHVNVSGDDLDEVRRRAIAAAALLRGEAPSRVEPVETGRATTDRRRPPTRNHREEANA